VCVPARPRCGRRTVVYHRRATARVTRCRRTEHRCRWTFSRPVTALAANRRRGVVFDHDGLTHLAAGVPASVDRVPALGRTIRVTAGPSCRGRAVVYYRRATARITRCRRTEYRRTRTLSRRSEDLPASRRRGAGL